ncbi:MAG: aminotransferase class I/II-fold pyridoxal phosphate-dependent enzyme [Victivallales bacterium]|nr:aminotransferase class I/II-fold pyridoxal phosphate-dependent enzyme [Victivallales bacterium]
MNIAKKAFRGEVWTNVHPALLQRMVEVNDEPVDGNTGDDRHSRRAAELMQKHFRTPVSVTYALNGTGANILALKGMLDPCSTVLCAAQAHVNTYECGGLEYNVGAKILSIEAPDGKLTPGLLDTLLLRIRKYKYHPKVVVVTEPTEFGTLYTPEELKAVCDFAHGRDMLVYLDGARIGSAVAAFGTTLGALVEGCGVDVFSFGGTKAGAMFGEMIVALRPECARNMRYAQKQSLQHLDKSKYLGVQMEYILEHDLWLANGAKANEMARRLEQRLREKGVHIFYPVESNMVFCVMAPQTLSHVTETFDLHYWDEERHVVRLATTYLTTMAEVETMASLLE